MFKKILILSFVILFIVSCGEDTSILSENGLILKETKDLSIKIPSNWEIIENKEDILPKAKDGKIELAIASKNIINGFSNNLLILSDELNKFVTSKEFSMLNNIGASTDYIDYKKLESKNFIFTDDEESILYIFEAKYNLDTPKLKFLQTAHICNQNKAYFLTLAIPTTVNDTSKYEYLLSTFNCKK